jgi:hypothetical protein
MVCTGARFLGAINDIVIWPSALTQLELRRNMHRVRSMAELAPVRVVVGAVNQEIIL